MQSKGFSLCKHSHLEPSEKGEVDDTIFVCIHVLEESEHGLQSDQTTHKVIEIHRQIWLRISGDNQLMQGVAQFETCRLHCQAHFIGIHAS